MTEVVIYDLSDPLRRRTIYADSGNLRLARGTDLDMTLYHGVMEEVPNNKPGELTRLFYHSTVKRVRGVFSSFQESKAGTISKGDREMSICEMHRELARGDWMVRQADYDLATLQYERLHHKGKKPIPPKPGAGFGLSKLYCGLLSLAKVKEAHAQVPRFPRGGVGLVIGVSFAVFGIYYVGLIGGETLADKGFLPPWVAMWAANIILLIVGLALASRMGREASTTRGGDFAELMATARSRVFGWMRLVGIPVERRQA